MHSGAAQHLRSHGPIGVVALIDGKRGQEVSSVAFLHAPQRAQRGAAFMQLRMCGLELERTSVDWTLCRYLCDNGKNEHVL